MNKAKLGMWIGGAGVLVVTPAIMFVLSRVGPETVPSTIKIPLMLVPLASGSLLYLSWKRSQP